MSFNSALFLVFFPIVTALYFLLPHRARWALLLVASCFFYACYVPVYLLILFGIILVDFAAGILMEKTTGWKRKALLLASIVANLGTLLVFKYISWNGLAFLLPIGLAFHTLQSVSYAVEVYRGNQKAERHLGIFALFVMFYPQLVAGPIERPQHMLHQFHEEHSFDLARLNSGLRLMLWGFFLKIVVADRLAFFVNPVFENPHYYPGLSLVIATVFFAFQIYGDFAGYSLIALGSAKAMGFDLMQNFNRPYSATSISEFWRRWHISLSSWLRDYVYIPLGGNRKAVSRNLLITFLLSGLWHGAGWTYLAWGGLNGIYLIVASRTAAWRSSVTRSWSVGVKKMVQISSTFTLTCIAWIFFRAATIGDAIYIIKHLLSDWGAALQNTSQYIFLNLPKSEFILAIAGIVSLLTVEWWQVRRQLQQKAWLSPGWRPWATVLLVLIIFLFGEFRAQTFIYFRF